MSLPRILFVENDPMRESRVNKWLDEIPYIRLVPVSVGNIAITVIEKDLPRDWDGIMLDHDLNEMNRGIPYKSGLDVAKAVARRTHKDTPIIIHSMNPEGSARIKALLDEEGFSSVTKIPFSDMKKADLFEWLEEVEEFYDESVKLREGATGGP